MRILNIKVLSRVGAALIAAVLLLSILGVSTLPNIQFDDSIPSGSVVSPKQDLDGTIRFSLRPDSGDGQEKLWFHFKVSSDQDVQPWFEIRRTRAHQRNWNIVRPVFSEDGINWVRASEVQLGGNRYGKLLSDGSIMRFRSPIKAKQLQVAYAYPYTPENLDGLVNQIENNSLVKLSWLAGSEEGTPIRRIDVSKPQSDHDKDVIWVIAREHPGETPSSYVAEGFILSLVQSEVGHKLLDNYDFKIVPMVSPESVTSGTYYRNTKGIDLAQDWLYFKSREMQLLINAMEDDLKSNKVALLLNLHSANNSKGHHFLETNQDWLSPKLAKLQKDLFEKTAERTSELSIEYTFPTWDYPYIASNYLNNQYGVYCWYVESNYHSVSETQITPDSLRELGKHLLGAIEEVQPTSSAHKP